MKNLKILVVMAMAFGIFISTRVTIDATENEVTMYDNEEWLISNDFNESLAKVYAGNKLYSIYNKEGKDITKDFIDATLALYNDNDLRAIEKKLMDENLAVVSDTDFTMYRGNITNRFNKTFRHVVTVVNNKNSSDKKVIDIAIYVSGSATCDSKGKIISHTGPTNGIANTSVVKNWEMRNVQCYSTINGATMSVVSKFTPYYYTSIYGYPEKTYVGSNVTDSFSYSPMY